MRLSFDKWSALYVMRSLRVDRARSHVLWHRTGLVDPDPSPLRRWGKHNFDMGPYGVFDGLPGQKVYVAASSPGARPQSRRVSSTVYGKGIPPDSFIDIGDGFAISSPELLFVEMAALMHPIEHLMLGHELCGSFGRDARDPRNGDVAYGLPALTSVERIGEFLAQAQGMNGIARARESFRRLDDNAWSPTESLIAAFLRCPIDDMGFELDALELNKRVFRNQALPDSKGSRVPDILIGGTKVGVNYDGLVHLDLESIARAAFEMGVNPAASHTELELRRAMERVRAKALDDIRRNRELAVSGYTVFPILKEDLYQRGGFDRMVAQLVGALKLQGDLDLWAPKRALASSQLCADRYRLLLSLLPGKQEIDVKLGRYLSGIRISDEKPETFECWIEF